MPIILNSAESKEAGIDLIVEVIAVRTDIAQVNIKNIGTVSVSADSAFWVDLYIGPEEAPTGVNQVADDLGGNRLIWGVVMTPTLEPQTGVIITPSLAPQETLTLQIGDRYFQPSLSQYPSEIKAGTVIYAQVDSADVTTDYGSILETHERNGAPYNNISKIALSQDILTEAWPRVSASGIRVEEKLELLPRRK